MRGYPVRLLSFANSGRCWLMGACGLLLLPGTVGAQTASPAPPADVFAGDARLMQSVMVQAPGLAVKDLLARLSAKTGVMLTADKATAEDKVVVFSPARPLQATLADVAMLFNDVWRREPTSNGKPRYLLTRSSRASALEETLLNKSRSRLMAQLDAQVRALAETPEQLAMRPADDPIRKNLMDAEKRTSTEVYAALTPEQRDILFSRRFLNFAVNVISPQMREPVRKLYEDSIRFIGRFRQPNDANPRETVDDYARHGVQFAVHTSGGQVLPAVQVFGNGSMKATFFAELDARKQWILPPHGSPYVQTASLPLPAIPPSEQTRQAGQEKQWLNKLRALAALSGKPVLADFYRSNPVNAVPIEQAPDANTPPANSQPADNTPAAHKATTDTTAKIGRQKNAIADENIAALDALCRPVGYLWWTRTNGALLLRKRDWYEQRLYEVPEDWLQETVKRMAAQNNTPTLADLFRARELTAQQILGLNSFNTSDNYSYSETEAAGATELLALLERQLATSSLAREPLKPGRVHDAIYSVEGDSLLAARETLQEFVNAQSHPLSFADMKIFRVDVYSADRSPVPVGGYKDAELTLMWRSDNATMGSHTIRLPFHLPNDPQVETKIELEPTSK